MRSSFAETPAGTPQPIRRGTAPHEAPGRVAGGAFLPLRDRRRRYLVDPAYQLRSAVIAVLGMTFVLGMAAGVLRLVGPSGGIPPAATSGGIGGWALFIIALGAVFITAVFLTQIAESHKAAGSIQRVRRSLERLGSGSWGTRLALRREDHFQDLAVTFNDAARTLCERAEEDARALRLLGERLDLLAGELVASGRPDHGPLIESIGRELERLRKRHSELLRASPGVRFEPKL